MTNKASGSKMTSNCEYILINRVIKMKEEQTHVSNVCQHISLVVFLQGFSAKCLANLFWRQLPDIMISEKCEKFAS